MSGLPPAPNPYSFYAWMPPDIAKSSEALAILDVCCFVVISYDIICHLSFDIARVKELRFNKETLLRGSTWYLVARFFAWMATFTGVTYEYLRYTGNCSANWIIFTIFYALGNATNSLLLGLRVVAFWNKNKRILWLLGILVLIVLGLDTSITWAAKGYALRVGDKQIGCVIGDILKVNGVNVNIMGWCGTMGYDAICFMLILYRLWHANDQVVPRVTGEKRPSAPELPTTRPQPTSRFITPFLRRQAVITYALSWSASLAFIIVQINPGNRIDLVGTIAFAVPFLTFQNCLISYMFRSLFNFTQQEQQHTPIIGTGATPILGGGSSRRGSGGGAPGSVNGHFGSPAGGATASFDSHSNAGDYSAWGTPKVNTSPRFSQAGALHPVTTRNSSSFSGKLPTWSTVSGSSPPTLVSANMARESRLQTPPRSDSRDGSMSGHSHSHPFQGYTMDPQQRDNVFRITQTHDVEIAPPAGAHFV